MASYLPGCVLYFFLFMSLGSIMPFLPVIWRSKGMDDDDIGVLGAIRPVAVLVAGPLICAFADRYGIQQKVLYGLVVLFAVTRSSVLVAGSFLTLAAVEVTASVFQSPIISLVDSAVRNSFGAAGYGPQRMCGAAGYGAAALVSGAVYGSTGGGYRSVVVVFVAALAVSLVAAVGVPLGNRSTPADGNENGGPAGGIERDLPESPCTTPVHNTASDHKPSEADSTAIERAAGHDMLRQGGTDDDDNGGVATDLIRERADETPETTSAADTGISENRSEDDGEPEEHGAVSALWIMFGTPRDACFFAAVTLSGMGKGVIDTFLFIWLDELGGSHLLLGLAALVMCSAEVPFFYLSGPLIQKIGPRNVVALAQLGYIVRFLYYSVLKDPWWVLPAEVFHGLTFAAMWAATTDYSHGIAPAHLRTTMLATVSGLKRGLGYGLGSIVGGVMYSSLGPRLCFKVCACLPSLALLLLFMRPWNRACGDKRKYEGRAMEEGLEGWGTIGPPREDQDAP